MQRLDEENVEDLFIAANQYLLPGLKKICELDLIARLTLENSLGMLYLGCAYGASDLKSIAKQRIVKAGLDYINSHSNEIKEIDPDLLLELRYACGEECDTDENGNEDGYEDSVNGCYTDEDENEDYVNDYYTDEDGYEDYINGYYSDEDGYEACNVM